MSEVTWRPIPGFESYSASSDGQVRNKSGRVLKLARKEDGYMHLKLTINKISSTKLVHHLVASAFLDNPDNLPEIDHKNRVRDDNRVKNLEWVSKADNHARRQLRPSEDLKGNRTTVWKCDVNTGDKLEAYNSLRAAADAIGSKWTGSICNVVKGRNMSAFGFKWMIQEHEEMKNEIWRLLNPNLVNGVLGNFISSEGRIKNRFGTVREGYIHTSGYKRVCIGKKDFLVHRLVAQTFLPNFFGKPLINHIDGDKKNPRLYNLQWATSKENTQHAHDTGLIAGRRPVRQFALDGTHVADFTSIAEAIEATGDTYSGIWLSITRNTLSGNSRWMYIEKGDMTLPEFAGRVRPVRQLNLNGTKIKDFKNISQAAKAIGMQRTLFRQRILRNAGVCEGYKWEFLT